MEIGKLVLRRDKVQVFGLLSCCGFFDRVKRVCNRRVASCLTDVRRQESARHELLARVCPVLWFTCYRPKR